MNTRMGTSANFNHSLFSSTRCKHIVLFSLMLALCIVMALPTSIQAQNSGFVLTDPSTRFREITTSPSNRILLHLRNRHERIVAFPEPVKLDPTTLRLPGCEITLDNDVLGFYPTQTFDRQSFRVIGINSGQVYELGVRSSNEGLIGPLKLLK